MKGNKMMRKITNERGLTLDELLAVVVILGILATIAFVYIGGVIENSKKDAHVANALQIISATKLYGASGGKMEEVTSGEEYEWIKQISVEKLIEAQMLQEIIDPWTKKSYADEVGATSTGIVWNKDG